MSLRPNFDVEIKSYARLRAVLCTMNSSSGGTFDNSYGLNHKMIAWCRETLYWTATIIAGLLLAWVVWSYVSGISRSDPVILIVPLLLAAAIWTAGWVFCKALVRH